MQKETLENVLVPKVPEITRIFNKETHLTWLGIKIKNYSDDGANPVHSNKKAESYILNKPSINRGYMEKGDEPERADIEKPIIEKKVISSFYNNKSAPISHAYHSEPNILEKPLNSPDPAQFINKESFLEKK